MSNVFRHQKIMKQQNKIISFLNKFGIDQKDATVYLYGLSAGPQHVTQLAKNCKLTRSNAYDVVKRLAEKGLCKNLGSLYGKKVAMLPPKELVAMLKRKQREILELGNELEYIMPELEKLPKRKVFIQPKITYFEGIEGVRKLFESSLHTTDKEVLSVLSEQGIFSVLGKEFINDYVKRRIKNSLISRSIRPEHEKETQDPLYRNHDESLRKVRIKPKKLTIQSTILIFDNKVGFITVEEDPFGTLIESQDFAVSMKSWFEVLWDVSKEKKLARRQ